MNMKTFRDLRETVGSGGLDYEIKVYNTLKSTDIPNFSIGDKPSAGFSNVGSGDIEATYKGKPFNIEVKASARDQMGGGSFRYTMAGQTFTPVKEIDPEDLDLLMAAAKEKADDIDNYIKELRKLEPKEYHRNQSGIPLKASVEARAKLKADGYLAKINKNTKTSTQFIIRHYNKKGVYYIQVGGSGLFYMGSNPFKLPVPELKGEIQIEMRLGFGGGKLTFPTDPPTPARSAGLRLQARLITRGKSPYSLDKKDDIQSLFDLT